MRYENGAAEAAPEPVEKFLFSDNLCFDFAKHGRPKVPVWELSLFATNFYNKKAPSEDDALMELITRFELVTSSLPRMHSTY